MILSNKKEIITTIYEQTLNSISGNVDNWLKFLDCSSNNYKYKFNDQILIFAQKPNAVACAELKIWNKVLKRWVNKGAKGIALIKENEGYNYLRYVFDLSDTKGKSLKIWSVSKEYEEEIIKVLQLKFSDTIYKKDLAQTIISISKNIVQDNIQDYLLELLANLRDSNLRNLDEDIIRKMFENTVEKGISYIILKRCGIEPLDYIKKEEFFGVLNYNTTETIIMLGLSTTDMARMCLKEIYNTIKKIEKNKKNKNYTFDSNNRIDYNEENRKGSVNNEYNLYTKGELFDTKFRNGENVKQKSKIGQIFKNETKIFEGEQKRNVHNVSSEKQINRTFVTNTRSDNKENDTNNRENEETVWNNRGTEREKSNRMDKADEQYSSNSRTNGSERDNIQLDKNNNISDIKSEYSKLEKEVDNTSFFDEKIVKNTENFYDFATGDIIYIGEKEYIISNIDEERITIYDNQFPLYKEKILKKDILKYISENPMNDYLKERKILQTENKEENYFDNWIDNFIKQKSIDLEKIFTIEEGGTTCNFKIKDIIDAIKNSTYKEQETIKSTLQKYVISTTDFIEYLKFQAKFSVIVDNNHKRRIKQGIPPMDAKGSIADNEVTRQIIKRMRNIENFDLYPEIPTEKRNNFKIEDNNLGIGTLKEKYKNNIEAIKILKLCEEQKRYATIKEQEILSKYVGWGGLKYAFDEKNNNWSDEYVELKNLLSEEEYKNARASSLTAYYTPPVVIKNIYKALRNMGLKQANILEPSCRNR